MWADWAHYPCRLGGPQRFGAGVGIRSGPHVPEWLHHPFRLGGPQHFRYQGTKTEVVHIWADWLHHRCRLGGPQRFSVGNEVESGPHVGGLATSPLPSRGSPKLHCGKQSRKWPTCGRTGHITLAVRGVPNASRRGTELDATPPLPSRGSPTLWIGGPVEGLATSTLPSRGYPTLHTPALSRIPRRGHEISGGCGTHAFLRAHKLAELLRNPCDLGHP